MTSRSDGQRLAWADAAFQASDGGEHHPPGRVRRKYRGIERERGPHIRSRITHGLRNYADHGIASAVQTNRFSNDPRIRTEAVPPQCFTQESDVFLSLLALICQKGPAEDRRNSQH